MSVKQWYDSAALGAPADVVRAQEAALPPLLAVVGPTASGKSGLAVALAEALGGEIVNTDSLQVYRHFDVGTAKPSMAERSRVPHHVIDVADADEPYSAGRFVADAREAIAAIAARGRVPVICGGTGLYYRALVQGLATIPPVPAPLQAAVESRVAAAGPEAAHGWLARVDAEAAAVVHPNDPVRIARALGVYEATGRPLSAFRRAQPFRAGAPQVFAMALRWERRELYERINGRVREMLAQGWVEEVRGLLERGYGTDLKPMQAIGYREIASALGGGASSPYVEAALAEPIALRTRHYAKRQLTWFRRHPEVQWVQPGEVGAVAAAARNFLLGCGVRR